MSIIQYQNVGAGAQNPGLVAPTVMFGSGLVRDGDPTHYQITGSEGVSLVFGGGFSYNDKGALKSGVATSCEIRVDGELFATITGIDASARELKDLNTPKEFFDLLGKMTVNGGASDDYVISNDKVGVLHGGSGEDLMAGGKGDDQLFGDDGNDLLYFSHGRDVLDGGTGVDAISFGNILQQDFTGPDVHIDLGKSGFQTVADGISLKLTSIEDVYGGAGDDKLTGDAEANLLFAGDGRDTVSGGAGDDMVVGGSGADVLKGGAGEDTLSMNSSAKGVTVSLAKTGVQNTGEGKDAISGFENLIGSSHNDKLTGDGNANHIEGGSGDDTIVGNGGYDGLAGGSGADTFVFNKHLLDETPGRSEILDFQSPEHDVIDLSAIDANSIADGNQDFAFIGTAAFSGVAGQLRWQYINGPGSDIAVFGDLNGDKIIDFGIQLRGPIGALTASDFDF